MIFRRFSGVGGGLALWMLAGALACVADPPEPPLPSPRSPVDFFRELLAMNADERRAALTNRTPEVRARVLAKVVEYELMPPDLAEVRLRATELRWYLVPLMKLPPAERQSLAITVPSQLRKLVADRLERWDLLPAEARHELLDNELALDYFTQAGAPGAEQQRRLLEGLPPAQRQRLEADIRRWDALPATERQQLFERVNHFFDLTPREQEKVKATLSAQEREQMEQTLNAFANLPREQRVQCIRSFQKFAGLSATERRQFLQDAGRWSAMPVADREQWRQLVRRLPEMPPLPPDFHAPPPPLPPVPAVKSSPVATNGS